MKKIMVVEPDGGLRDTLGTILLYLKHHPVLCRTTSDAMNHLQDIDLIITEFVMPGGVTSEEFIQKVTCGEFAKNHGFKSGGIPVIVITGGAERFIPPSVTSCASVVLDKPLSNMVNVIGGHIERIFNGKE